MPLGNNTSGHIFDTTFTTNGPLYSAASGVVTSGAAGSSGQVYQSAGAGSAPGYSTATFPSVAGTSGKVLISDGTNIISSTPTFPNASATLNKIIKSDGTNWIASTETYAAPGTSGNVLTSDGTNWTSAAAASGVALTLVDFSLTSAQIKALHGTPIQVVATPGAGKIICVVNAYCKFTYGGSNVFVAAASQSINLYWGTARNSSVIVSNGNLVQSASSYAGVPTNETGTATVIENLALNLYNPIATEITGNAGNNNVITGRLLYYTVTVP